MSPGQSPGTLTWLGDFDQGGVDDFLIEIAGTTQGTEYDFLDIQGGNAILDGTLTIDLLGFLPLATDVFEILRVDAGQLLSGRFSSVRTLGGGNFDVVTRSAASGTSIVLTNFMAPLAVPTPAPALLLLSLLAFLRRAKLCPVIPGR